MMGGHTPGSWRVPKHAPFQVEQENALLGSAVLAEVHAWEAGGRSKAERDANARLIAAAPDLLAACKRLENWSKHPSLGWPEFAEIGEDVRAAIAKAEKSESGVK